MNLESANLILRTSSTTNKNASNTSVTWNNINLKAVLGTLYDKYDRFKICLTSFANITTTAIAATSDRVLLINMRGLQWENQTFDTLTNTNRDTAIIATTFINSNNGANYNYTGEIGWVFLKPADYMANINISFTRTLDNNINTAMNYGESVYCFSIYGVEEK